ncbi:MAG: rhomboid family intramembrane serine protease [Clostridia bacterium]|nr:rhomboid family intramembrane serine protease [Clostridia bacterium]
MVPLRDSEPSGRFPWVTITLILVNLYVFMRQWLLPPDAAQALIAQWGVIPARVDAAWQGAALSQPHVLATLVTATFLHGGWLHVAGNMLFLWVFGDNIEARLGSLRYLLFYLAAGVVGNVAHVLANPGSLVPAIGASGAVAGVLGAYLVLYPRSRVRTLIFLGIFITVIEVPALLLLLYWFLVQLANGLAAVSMPGVATVAYWAHIGGFALGMVVARLLPPRRDWGRD